VLLFERLVEIEVDLNFDLYSFAEVRPKGFWSDRQNQREFLDQLADQLTLKTVAPLISRLDCIFIKIRSVAC